MRSDSAESAIQLGFAAIGTGLTEGQVRLDPGFVRLVDPGRFRHEAFALGAFGRKQMAARCMLTEDLARGGDLEPLRDGFPGLTARNRLWHKARKITQSGRVTTAFARRKLRQWKTRPNANRRSLSLAPASVDWRRPSSS